MTRRKPYRPINLPIDQAALAPASQDHGPWPRPTALRTAIGFRSARKRTGKGKRILLAFPCDLHQNLLKKPRPERFEVALIDEYTAHIPPEFDDFRNLNPSSRAPSKGGET
jgi:hypothetical protein